MKHSRSVTPTMLYTLLCVVGLLCVFFAVPARAEDRQETEAIEESPISDHDRDHWSFQPLQRPKLPAVKRIDWIRNPIDHFILARLEAEGLSPSPEADRVTLIRRLAFDLTGLPPSPDEVDRFVADRATDAYERLVDRLLEKPAYGERWAQHWLDLARFAETDGFEHDHVRPNAWRYRDWVIDALNRDLPYDQFVRLQLAGDEIAPDDPDAAIATGFLLCGPDMPDINSQEERRNNFLNDMTGTVGTVFLGLHIGCAQCHEHKFDPISQHDFYRLRAFVDPLQLFEDRPLLDTAGRKEFAAFESQKREVNKKISKKIKALERKAVARIRREKSDPKLKPSRKQLRKQLNAQEKADWDRLHKELKAAARRKMPGVKFGRVASEPESYRASSFLLIRGDFRRKGPQVSPAFLRVVHRRPPNEIIPPLGHKSTGRRTALAKWLTRADHPLTPRVIANRLWQHHFTRGLVGTPSNFGVMGDPPTHPQLLDWLATEFPRRDWSLKQMHRLIVTSATYRQASRLDLSRVPKSEHVHVRANWKKLIQKDPDNELLGRMHRRRLEGEAIRDAMLFAAGILNEKRGGPGVRPPLPDELLVTLLKNQWPVTKDTNEHRRRSIYLFVRRNLRYPLFDVFDRPDTNQSCPQRDRSTIAPQALTLFNSVFSLQTAQAMAERVLSESGDDVRKQIVRCYRHALGREPTEREAEIASAHVAKNAAMLHSERQPPRDFATPEKLPSGGDPLQAAALTDFCLVLINLNEFVYVD